MEGSSENKCPLCGKETQDGDLFCHDCQEIARNEYPEEILKTKEDTTEEQIITEDSENIEEEPIEQKAEPVKKKKSKKLIIFFFIGIIVCVIAGAIGSHITKEAKQSKAMEMAFWDECIEENTTLAYSKYLVRFPDGIFHKEAQSKILELKRIEDSTWISISKSNNVDKLYSYINDYPTTPYKKQIRRQIDSLSWIAFSKENTAAAYQTYLENIKLGNYDGKYQEEAQKLYDYLGSLKIVEGEELDNIKKELKQTFKLLSEQKYTELQKNIPDTLFNFYGQKGKKVSQIIDSLKADNKKKQIKSIDYTINTDAIEVVKDIDNVYYTGFPVVKQFTYTNKRKKKDAVKLSIQVELNNKMQLQSIYKEKKTFP